MELIKNITILVLSFVVGFGLWYLIFWFVTSEPDLFTWHWGIKIFYLILAGSSSQGTFEVLIKNS
jgi:hypothetical protein